MNQGEENESRIISGLLARGTVRNYINKPQTWVLDFFQPLKGNYAHHINLPFYQLSPPHTHTPSERAQLVIKLPLKALCWVETDGFGIPSHPIHKQPCRFLCSIQILWGVVYDGAYSHLTEDRLGAYEGAPWCCRRKSNSELWLKRKLGNNQILFSAYYEDNELSILPGIKNYNE